MPWHDAGLLTTDGPVKNVRVGVRVASQSQAAAGRAARRAGRAPAGLPASTSSISCSVISSLLRPSTMMFVMAAAFLALLVAATPESACAYHAAISASPKRAAPVAAFVTRPFGGASTSMRRCSSAGSTVLSLASSDEDGYPIVSSGDGRVSRRKRAVAKARTFGELLIERMDTMDAAFGEDADVEVISADGNRPSSGGGDAKGLVPMQAGVVKTGIQIAIAFWLFKKIKKVSESPQHSWKMAMRCGIF